MAAPAGQILGEIIPDHADPNYKYADDGHHQLGRPGAVSGAQEQAACSSSHRLNPTNRPWDQEVADENAIFTAADFSKSVAGTKCLKRWLRGLPKAVGRSWSEHRGRGWPRGGE